MGWQVMLDGLEITQYTYFQQCGGMDLDPICGEITYGLERIAGFLQDVDSIYDIVWAVEPDTGRKVTYGEMRLAEEEQFSAYSFDYAEILESFGSTEFLRKACHESAASGPRRKVATLEKRDMGIQLDGDNSSEK